MSNAAGGLYSTPNDMVKYMNFHLNKGKVGGQQVVPEVNLSTFELASESQKRLSLDKCFISFPNIRMS